MDREENYTYDSFGNVLSCEEVPGNNANDKITTYATLRYAWQNDNINRR